MKKQDREKFSYQAFGKSPKPSRVQRKSLSEHPASLIQSKSEFEFVSIEETDTNNSPALIWEEEIRDRASEIYP